jgi:hypothetical protein
MFLVNRLFVPRDHDLSPLRQCPGGRQQSYIRRWRVLQQIENARAIPRRELYMIRLIDYSLGGANGVMDNKICQVRVLQCHRPHEQRFLLGPNPQGHPAVILDRYSRHGVILAVHIQIVHQNSYGKQARPCISCTFEALPIISETSLTTWRT